MIKTAIIKVKIYQIMDKADKESIKKPEKHECDVYYSVS